MANNIKSTIKKERTIKVIQPTGNSLPPIKNPAKINLKALIKRSSKLKKIFDDEEKALRNFNETHQSQN